MTQSMKLPLERNEQAVLELIKARGDKPFSAASIATEAGLCRQTVYRVIRLLNTKGHKILGESGFGFLVRRLA